MENVEKKPYAFKEVDTVRISKPKLTFEKGYEANWTEELFTAIELGMDSSSDYSDCEDLISASEDDYSSSESESDDDTLNSARNWCPIDIHASTPAPPNFQFTSTHGINPSTKIFAWKHR
ncbi:hypothetical protein AVEN_138827-1 [Araneus ventricosus]|uniref:Uncharacterized protein n=1 Tax=Araneus ventricosus TaxID=182803 RepID=A0A4Y2SZP8_ARAVE|nr:hypothetical protein AVEN_138827-1 [Araneus ventricosus]